MSKKDYEAIAEVISRARASARNGGERTMAALIALNMADVFAADNPRFDRERFLTACSLSATV